MSTIFFTIFYQPLYNALIFLYHIVPGNDIGIAIILLTVLIKLILFPFSIQSIKSQKALQDIQPKINELKVKYKDDKEAMSREMMKIYKENKVNPFSSCLPLLIQLPFLFAVYRVFMSGLTKESFDALYSFIPNPEHINAISFGFLDLSKPQIALAVLAGLAQFMQTKMLTRTKPAIKGDGSKDEGMASMMNKQMMFMMPILTVIIGMSLPGGLALYWLTTTLLMVAQQYYLFEKMKYKEAMATVGPVPGEKEKISLFTRFTDYIEKIREEKEKQEKKIEQKKEEAPAEEEKEEVPAEEEKEEVPAEEEKEEVPAEEEKEEVPAEEEKEEAPVEEKKEEAPAEEEKEEAPVEEKKEEAPAEEEKEGAEDEEKKAPLSEVAKIEAEKEREEAMKKLKEM